MRISKSRSQAIRRFEKYQNSKTHASAFDDKIVSECNSGKWDDRYRDLAETPDPKLYGCTVTYAKAVEFLSDCKEVEDWGCGSGGFINLRPDAIGVDGSKTRFAKKIADLRTYTTDCEAVHIRHVLEHNYAWKDILINALESASRKIVITMFIPLIEGETKELAHNRADSIDVPDMAISRSEFMEIIHMYDVKMEVEKMETATEYNREEMFFITKSPVVDSGMEPADADIIIVSYNRNDLVAKILDRLKTQTGAFNVIICDDGSKELMQASSYPFVKKYTWTYDSGYHRVARFNEGLSYCCSKRVILLDDDTIPQGDSWFSRHMKNLDEFDISRGGMVFPSGAKYNDAWFSTSNIGIHACRLREIGGFDMNFDGCYGGEDIDLGKTIRKHKMTMSGFHRETECNHVGVAYGEGNRTDAVIGRNKNYFILKWGYDFTKDRNRNNTDS